MHPSKTRALFVAATLSLFNAACTAQPPASGQPEASKDAPRSDAAPHKSLPASPSSTPKGASDAQPSFTIDAGSFVPAGFEIRMEKHGDLNADGHDDALLVLQSKETRDKDSRPRALVIIGGTPDGRPKKLVENSSAVLCASCGGMMGDPLADITVSPGRFAIRFEGGSRELWSREYDFHYSQKDTDWILDHLVEKNSDRITGDAASKRLDQKDFDIVSINNFDPETMPASD
ncbi:hypothetical protein [Luteimonas panaciterrae]|uniref:hypothetical protein n=1 Tax=Luteimonas panaciterrae TaxID=363885 RepID=UPI001CF998F6|nr:hypothetical protein [Luteimonas panaciterrae]